jgi:hypothetical protein
MYEKCSLIEDFIGSLYHSDAYQDGRYWRHKYITRLIINPRPHNSWGLPSQFEIPERREKEHE